MDRNYRIHTNIASDTVLNVNMQQDYDFLEVLTMKLGQKDAYKLHSSNYGVIIGRVLANDAFGIPNAKISVFIERDANDPVDIENIYPYSEITSRDSEGRRYNLLPDYSNDDCYRIVGTFPNKRLLLDNDIQVEIYEKYWKYTTVTNNAGDYMIFGVPSGNQQVHVDIDLSDIGILSQKPRDFEYKGYNLSMFDNPNQFKQSTNLDGLAQLFSQNKSVFVYPFWGDADNGIAAITRCDVQIQYKFEPTCVFMGSIISDNDGNAIGHKCAVDVNNGMNDQLIAGEGTIEMIRKTQDGLVEEYQIQGNQLIDSDGVWCYQIPMNLDFIGTDEYGNIIPTDNPNKGIPTRTQVRFRISKHDTGDEGFSHHTAKYLVPMNPIFSEKEGIKSPEDDKDIIVIEDGVQKREKGLDGVQPVIESKGQEIENMYIFGSNTPQSCFRDLYWNNVYSVKNYIPKVQIARRPFSKNYGSLKGANLAEDKNPIPFNKLRVDLPFLYVIVCIIFDIITFVVSLINNIIICGINSVIEAIAEACIPMPFGIDDICPFGFMEKFYIGCIQLGEGLSEDTIFVPGCGCGTGQDAIDNPDGAEISSDTDKLKDLVVEKLAEDFKIIKLDLQQDWINGCLYMPLWYWRKRKKKTFLFGLFTLSDAKNQYCDCNEPYKRLRTYVTCNVNYSDNSLFIEDGDEQIPEDTDWHRKKADRVSYANGLIKGVKNKDGLTAYYYVATQPTRDNRNEEKLIVDRTDPFYAIRLYATDIILLGNLNEDNLYGIPQFFKVLPPTTANIPQIATIQEVDKMTPQAESEFSEDEEKNSDNEIHTEEDSGRTITTGMNWRHDGNNDDEPGYSWGLFMELACTEVKTKAKSCFNAERLSELGVNVDMNYNMSYTVNGVNNVQYGKIKPDGFISKLELDDMENRAMFATMNHIGFVPQPYQDSISGYTTQVEDEHTGYLIPKFRYIYPVDFDGRQQKLMERYFNAAFGQHMFDEADQSYLTFRLGADANPTEKGEKNRIRHFYHHYLDSGYYSMPLYNNSFYFYFGINKGSTAIDKFNKMFYANCYRDSKEPFSYSIDSRGKALCTSIYYKVTDSYAYIHFKTDDIQTPFTYTLYDSFGGIVISETEMETTEFVIGGKMQDGKVVVNNNGEIRYQEGNKEALCVDEDGEYVTCPTEPPADPLTYAVLENGTYILAITDVNGRTLSEEIKLTPPTMSFKYESINLGTKYYNDTVTPISYICNAYNQFYGVIRITNFYIDGYEFGLTKAELATSTPSKYVINASGTAITQSGIQLFGSHQVEVVFELISDTDEYVVKDCMCNIQESDVEDFHWEEPLKYFEFRVYRPYTYNMSITLKCDGALIEESKEIQPIAIANGEDFDTTLNGMPVRFMIGTVSDDKDSSVANTSHFYCSTGVTDPTDTHFIGWFNTHREEGYKFSAFTTTDVNDLVWSKYVKYHDINSVEDRKKIITYKFRTMFNLSNTAYISTSNRSEFMYEAKGGVHPTLYRVLCPDYTASNLGKVWKYSDKRYAANIKSTPNIVGENYRWNRNDDRAGGQTVASSPGFNGVFLAPTTNYVGNYFAAFTNNGRYTSSLTGKCSITTVQIPSRAAVNLHPNFWKPLTDDVEYAYNGNTFNNGVLKNAHTSASIAGPCDTNTQPHLRAEFVDRKLDYNLIVWTPTPYKLKLHVAAAQTGESEQERQNRENRLNKPLNNIRISGLTYNGVEMSYDDEYRVISGNTDGTPNKRLEYSYNVNDEHNNAITIYNDVDPNNVIWREEDTYIYNNVTYSTMAEAVDAASQANPTIEDESALEALVTVPNANKSYIKRLYSATVNGLDVRQRFWSTFNKGKLFNYWKEKNDGLENPKENYQSWMFTKDEEYYLFNHKDEDTVYNGDFKVSGATKNYPTKRLIDIGNIDGENMLNLRLTSCSYKMTPAIDEEFITAKTIGSSDAVKFNLYFQNNIEIITPEDASEDYANITFVPGGSDGEYRVFSGSVGSLYFKFAMPLMKNDGVAFNRCPKLIKILDESQFNDNGTYKTDAITYIKTASQKVKDNLFGNDSLDTRIDNATMMEFYLFTHRVLAGGNVFVDNSSERGDFYYSANTEEGREYRYFIYDTSKLGRLKLSDNQITRITMFVKSINLAGIKVFGILNSFDYYGNDTYRTNHIRSIEFSNVFDARDVELKIDTANTYVSVTENKAKTTGSVNVNGGQQEITIPDEEGGEAHHYPVEGNASGELQDASTDFQSFYQVITFVVKCENGQTNPLKILNQAFANIDNMMGASLIFSDGTRPNITVSPEVTADTNAKTITIKASLNVGDGIFFDNNWNGNTHVDLLMNTNGFVYKLSFKLNCTGQEGGYDTDNNRFDQPGDKLKTTVSIV